MSDSPIKLNLKALQKDQLNVEVLPSTPVATDLPETKQEEKDTSVGSSSITEAGEVPIKKEENTGDLKQDETQVITPEKKTGFRISFADVQKPNIVAQDLKKQETPPPEKSDAETLEEQGPPKEKIQFTNYESNFKKESSTVFKRIQNFRYTPKTRVGLLLFLIIISALSIGSLMILFPEKHSLSVYHASILEIMQKSEESIVLQTDTGSEDSSFSPEIENIEELDSQSGNGITTLSGSIEEAQSGQTLSENSGENHGETKKKNLEKIKEHILEKYMQP